MIGIIGTLASVESYYGASKSEIDALIAFYYATDGPSWTTDTNWITNPDVSTWFGITTAANKVTAISLPSNNLSGDADLTDLPWIGTISVGGNTLGAVDISGLTSLTGAYLNSSGITSLTASGCTSLLLINATGSSFSSLDLTGSTAVNELTLNSNPNLSSIVNLPNLVDMINLQVGTCPSYALPAIPLLVDLQYLYVFGTLSGGLDLSTNIDLRSVLFYSCALTQGEVDSTLASIYGARANYTYATPALNIGGSNASPSGVYEYSATPSNGMQYIYALENDDDAEGFNTWTITNSAEWWQAESAACLCAYQAKGAASAAAAQLDLTGNGYNVTSGAPPTWSSGSGWTSYAGFDTISGLSIPTTMTAVWSGDLDYSAPGQATWYNGAADWTGLVMQSYASSVVYAGFNAALGDRLSPTCNGNAGVLVYTKNESTNAQELFDDGVSKGSNTSGTTPTTVSAVLWTGTTCKAAALFDGELSGADITAISTALNAL